MNLNYNINNTLLSRNRNFFLGQVDYEWFRAVSVATGIQSGSIIFGTGSIEYIPFAPSTFFVSGTYAEGRIGSGSALGLPIKTAITGSGVWAVTGSNQFSIVIGGNLGFNQSEILTLSAGAGNMNLSGSKISSSFAPLGNQEYIINFGLTHTKGNIYNPLINWNAVKTSPLGNNVKVNGEVSASFNLVQNISSGSTDKFTNLAFIKEVSGSAQSSSFNNEFGFSVTASYTASINNVTGSTTMSFVCAEEALNQTLTFFNPNTTTAIGSASFVASNNSIHSLVTSINYNKGNISTASINYQTYQDSTTQDLEGNSTNLNANGISSSFELRKDATIQKAYIAEVTGSVQSGSYNNDYAFNQTASLTQNVNNTTGSVTMSIVVAEAGINTQQRFFNPTTSQALLTASFTAQTILGYNITASVINNKGNESNSNINYKVSSSSTTQELEGNTTQLNNNSSSFNLKKDIAVLVNYNNITASISGTYSNDYSFNQTASLTSSILPNTTGSVTMSLEIPEIGFSTSSKFFNPISTGIKILSASFVAQTDSSSYNITASVINNKGNESNSNINFKVSSSSTTQDLEGNTAELNGNSSSLNLKKDIAIIQSYSNITASINGTYKNNYSFNQTASLTSSILANTTGSVTMSLVIPEIGFSTSSLFFNPTSAGIKILSASFVTTTASSSYNITASVINNKGNESNANINYFVTGSGIGIGALESSSFNIRKDANTTMVTASFTSSTSSTYKNDYAFNQTASISSSFIPYFSLDSSSFYVVEENIIIPELSIDSNRWISSSAELGQKILTASFVAQTNSSSYNITASLITYRIPLVEYLIVGGGGGSGARLRVRADTGLPADFSRVGGGGAGGLLSGSLILSASTSYQLTVGAGGIIPTGSGVNTRSSNGGNSTFLNSTSFGGGYGGFLDNGDNQNPPFEVLGGDGGSGGGYGPSNGVAGQGNNGLGLGYTIGAGAGASSGSGASWLDGNVYAGGGGGWRHLQGGNFITASNDTGSFGGGGTAISNGAGGIATSGSAGVVKLRYSSSIVIASGGEITSASGYIYHTFTSASLASTNGTGSFIFDGLIQV